jgi:hypothetical protein
MHASFSTFREKDQERGRNKIQNHPKDKSWGKPNKIKTVSSQKMLVISAIISSKQ